ncbi:MAG: antitoxin Xre-like helix-turn-helix domain-containing protein [Trueperaceae bacterium]
MADAIPNLYRAQAPAPTPFGENIGLCETDVHGLIGALKRGLPVAAFDKLRGTLEMTRVELATVIGISERTLARRLKAGRFNSDESERIYRMARLLAMATDVLESGKEASVWLKTPKRYLKGTAPLSYADTEVGAQAVERLLGRIEHGVFS